MTHPMFVEKTCRLKFVRQNFIKAEKFARQNSYFHTPHPPPPPQEVTLHSEKIIQHSTTTNPSLQQSGQSKEITGHSPGINTQSTVKSVL